MCIPNREKYVYTQKYWHQSEEKPIKDLFLDQIAQYGNETTDHRENRRKKTLSV